MQYFDLMECTNCNSNVAIITYYTLEVHLIENRYQESSYIMILQLTWFEQSKQSGFSRHSVFGFSSRRQTRKTYMN